MRALRISTSRAIIEGFAQFAVSFASGAVHVAPELAGCKQFVVVYFCLANRSRVGDNK